MKTQKALARGAIISCVYLLFAISLGFIALLPPSSFSWFSPLASGKLFFTSENGAGFMILAAAILYLVHFVYGSLYFRLKYSAIMKKFAYGDTGNTDDISDWSFLRGFIAMFIVPVAFAVAGLNSTPLQIACLVWILLNITLSALTRTSNLFEKDSITIDAPLLMPWKEPEKSKHLYETIFFLRPVLEDKETWQKEVVKQYVYNEAKYHEVMVASEMKTRQREIEATEATIRLAPAVIGKSPDIG